MYQYPVILFECTVIVFGGLQCLKIGGAESLIAFGDSVCVCFSQVWIYSRRPCGGGRRRWHSGAGMLRTMRAVPQSKLELETPLLSRAWRWDKHSIQVLLQTVAKTREAQSECKWYQGAQSAPCKDSLHPYTTSSSSLWGRWNMYVVDMKFFIFDDRCTQQVWCKLLRPKSPPNSEELFYWYFDWLHNYDWVEKRSNHPFGSISQKSPRPPYEHRGFSQTSWERHNLLLWPCLKRFT